jgi:hypothetical protein
MKLLIAALLHKIQLVERVVADLETNVDRYKGLSHLQKLIAPMANGS